jgi:shikimate dehydrogenase
VAYWPGRKKSILPCRYRDKECVNFGLNLFQFQFLKITAIIDTPGKIYGLIGLPLTHSFSKKYFSEKFLKEGIADQFRYENFELASLTEFRELVATHPQLYGLNVTIPYKEKIIPYLDELHAEAVTTGAVNTVVIERDTDGKVIKTSGFNTDVTGFKETLKPYLKPSHQGALVLGSGGASKAVQQALKILHLPFLVVSRDKGTGTVSYHEITNEVLLEYPVIINATPLGTFPDNESFPPIPYELLSGKNLLYDLVYNPPETVFLLKGRQQGAVTLNGYPMLVLQAEAAWKIWQEYH